LRGGLFFGFWFFIMARPIFTQRQTHCSRRSRLKFFAEAFFQKSWKVFSKGLEQNPRPAAQRLSRILLEAGGCA